MMMQSYQSIQAEKHFFSGNLREAEACCRRMLSLSDATSSKLSVG